MKVRKEMAWITWKKKVENSPVCLIQDNNLVPAFGQRNFLLSKHFYFISDNIDASLIGSIELQNSLFEARSQ